jgi:hypothetical protein
MTKKQIFLLLSSDSPNIPEEIKEWVVQREASKNSGVAIARVVHSEDKEEEEEDAGVAIA